MSNSFVGALDEQVAARPYILELRADAESGSLAPLAGPTDY